MLVEPLRHLDDGQAKLRDAQLVLVFGARERLEDSLWFARTRRRYPVAHIVACSTAGEILQDEVGDLGVVGVAVKFEHTRVKLARVNAREFIDTETAAAYLAKGIDPRGLAHVIVISDGQLVNGSELARGLAKRLPKGVALTGGLAADGSRFQQTYVCADGPAAPGNIVAIALYGDRLRVGYGSMGGWDPTGHEMRVTRARGNLVEQLDGAPALDRYAALLGEDAADLPASGLLYPLYLRTPDGHAFVRTLLNVDKRARSLLFAGDLPVGSRAQLMHANFDRLVGGASAAATSAANGTGALALLISCIGRRLVLQGETKREIAAVRDALGKEATLAGFYSYGEICPSAPGANCELHNQTMTITTLREE